MTRMTSTELVIENMGMMRNKHSRMVGSVYAIAENGKLKLVKRNQTMTKRGNGWHWVQADMRVSRVGKCKFQLPTY
jgi:hypothetical protein